ncbi:MAG: type II secretion system F family protein [Phycisphaerales bacterium]
MATFAYEALNASGKPQKGTIDAATSEDAIKKVKEQGFFPTSVREQKGKKDAKKDGAPGASVKPKKKKGGGFSIGGVATKQITAFTRQLSTLQDAGLPLLRSLQILEEQQKPGKFKSIIQGVCEEVEGGSSLSEGMAKFPKAFDRLFTKMVAAGEIGGVLDIILQRLAEFMEKAQRLKRKVVGASMYPVMVIVIAVGIVTFIMVKIIPKFKEIFAEFGVSMPLLTQKLIETSSFMAGSMPGQKIPGWVLIIGVPFALMFLWKSSRKTNPGRAVTDTVVMYVPVMGALVKKTAIAKFTRTLGTLINAGVPILEAISITRDTVGNYVYEKALNKVHDSIREGETFAQPLREAKVVDSLVVNMIDVGEETGDLDAMLLKIADNYDEEVDVAVNGMVKLIEPLLVVVLGGTVGTIVVAMFLPLVAIIEKLQGGG